MVRQVVIKYPILIQVATLFYVIIFSILLGQEIKPKKIKFLCNSKRTFYFHCVVYPPFPFHSLPLNISSSSWRPLYPFWYQRWLVGTQYDCVLFGTPSTLITYCIIIMGVRAYVDMYVCVYKTLFKAKHLTNESSKKNCFWAETWR